MVRLDSYGVFQICASDMDMLVVAASFHGADHDGRNGGDGDHGAGASASAGVDVDVTTGHTTTACAANTVTTARRSSARLSGVFDDIEWRTTIFVLNFPMSHSNSSNPNRQSRSR